VPDPELKALPVSELLARLRPKFELLPLCELLLRLREPGRSSGTLREVSHACGAGLLSERVGQLRDAALAGNVRAATIMTKVCLSPGGFEARRFLRAVVSRDDLRKIAALCTSPAAGHDGPA